MNFNTPIVMLIILITLFTINPTQAQEDLEIITFDNDSNSSNRNASNTWAVIKTNPVSFIFGQQFVELEYLITDYLSVEGGVGLTFRPTLQEFEATYIEVLNDIISPECTSTNYEQGFDFCDANLYNDFSIRKTGLGPWLSLGAKFYIFNDAMDGPYISLNLKYHRNNYQVLKVEEDINFMRTVDDYVGENQSNFDYTVRYGTQVLFGPLTTEYFVGVGIRNITQNRLDVGFDIGKDTWTNSFQTTTNSIFHFETGVRLGLEFQKAQKKSTKKKKRRRRR